MMEVKKNTAVDLNDLLAPSKNSGSNEVDDAVITNLTDKRHDLVNCDLIKTNDKPAELENGNVAMKSLINEVDIDADLNDTVNSELEDALLAEDDVLPENSNNKIVESSSAVNDDDILADKVETSNSTTSSSNARDPGDDLDTLLSKINDIVEECTDNESENTEQQTINNIVACHEQNNLNESVIFVTESNINDESNLKKKEKLEPATQSVLNNGDKENVVTNSETIPETQKSSDEIETPVEEVLTIKTEEKSQDKETSISGADDISDECTVELQQTEDIIITPESSPVKTLETNLNLEKTEESKTEVVQDNEITSNSNEMLEAVKTSSKSNEEIVDKTSSMQENEIVDIKVIAKNNEDDISIATSEKTSQSEEKSSAQNTKISENIENEDSDDEIVFYVDKPPEIEKSSDMETKPKETDSTNSEKFSQQIVGKTPEKKMVEDDDVVLLLDDDDEDAGHNKKVEEIAEISTNKQEGGLKDVKDSNDAEVQKETKDIDLDNSDNARDDFVSETLNEKLTEKTTVAETPEETNSNCSSSSNLLQEAKTAKNVTDEATLEEAENEEEEDEGDGDVELIESEIKELESLDKVEDSELPTPAKRIRLNSEISLKETEESSNERKEVENSTNDDENKTEFQEGQDEDKISEITSSSTYKRSHDVIEVEADEKLNEGEGTNKKPRTDDLTADVESSEIRDLKFVEGISLDDKNNLKAVPSYKPIPLYPAPKLEDLKSESGISLDFLKKFRKSFDNMTKQDLEELVLQKVVEAIIHRSEFSEMRELIEKQEKLITTHRSKISELSKQFRDLEMVHNRVVKDIEQRNSQFIMPVKITRAVGLQVYIPNKKSLTETAASSTGPNVPISPQRPVSSQASSTSSTALAPPQRQFIASQAETQQPQQRSGNTVSTGPISTGNVRRGCAQKVTPIRPVPGVGQTPSVGQAAASTGYRNTPNHVAQTQPRILNKNAATTVNATALQRSRYMGPNQDTQQRMPVQQQISRTPNIPANNPRVATIAVTQSKPTSTVAGVVQRRSESLSPGAANSSTSSIVDNYINTLTHLTGGNTAVSITPAKPKEKAVIDLTDEDEAPGQASTAQPANQMPVAQAQRRSLPTQNTTNSQHQFGRVAPSLARIPPNANQLPNNKNRQISSLQAQKSNTFTSISTPPGTSITRINLPQNAANVQRVKYSHPAPLPATPPQAFNPTWKLPPPRPTIRISNLDNGIVISWTMEESMDRHAECVSYQIYAYQETSGPPMVDSWRHVGDVKAMLLPMAVTLTQFQEGQRYYFAVRAVDCHLRYGPFSLPKTWS